MKKHLYPIFEIPLLKMHLTAHEGRFQAVGIAAHFSPQGVGCATKSKSIASKAAELSQQLKHITKDLIQ